MHYRSKRVILTMMQALLWRESEVASAEVNILLSYNFPPSKLGRVSVLEGGRGVHDGDTIKASKCE